MYFWHHANMTFILIIFTYLSKVVFQNIDILYVHDIDLTLGLYPFTACEIYIGIEDGADIGNMLHKYLKST